MEIESKHLKIPAREYNAVFIVEDRNLWPCCKEKCNKDADMILCTDFALHLELTAANYQVYYLDQIVDTNVLHHYNFEMHTFLETWHQTPSCENLLMYEGFNIGDALQLNVFNDVTYFCHYFFNLLAVKHINYKNLYVCVKESLVLQILNKLNIPFYTISPTSPSNRPVYLFPISKWMNEKVYRTSLKDKFKDIVARLFDFLFAFVDSAIQTKKTRIYIQGYYPTFGIINKLKEDKNIGLVLGNYTNIRNIYKERRVSFSKLPMNMDTVSPVEKFIITPKKAWVINGYMLSDFLQELIEPIVRRNFTDAVAKARSIDSYFKSNPIKLMVPVTNLWVTNRLIMNYCKNNNIPIFMVINGLLIVDFAYDALDSDWVNCYSESMKKEYFKNKATALPLGDPRMDAYVNNGPKVINRDTPTIVIGAGAFDPTDLRAYLAYEFDFLYDILKAITQLRHEGMQNKIILKIRANGYVNLYQAFVNEYFADLNIRLEQTIPFGEVISEADLYITFYSQTVFEASCLGIPAIYYKKDVQTFHSPFDANSELVTPIGYQELEAKLRAFYQNDDCFEAFLDKKIMEKYIGSLDGKNTQRNTDFIYSLIQPN